MKNKLGKKLIAQLKSLKNNIGLNKSKGWQENPKIDKLPLLY